MKMNKNLLSILLIGLTPMACASTPKFETLDVDKDNFVSPSEALALPCLARNYGELHRESKQGLNRSELEAAAPMVCSPESTPSDDRGGHKPRRH